LKSEIADWFPDSPVETIAQTAKHISLQLSVPDRVLYSQSILNSLIGEFERQFCRQTTEDSSISLTIQNHTANILLKEQAVQSIENPLYLNTETLYIDDPTVIENLRANNVYRHRAHLIQKLEEKMEQNTVDAVIYDEKMKHIMEHVNRVCGGKILREGRELLYQISDNSSPLSMKNVSTGIKMFAIIKRLIENGALGFNSTLILDEPEIHVHPKWQLVFAEIIVLLQKEFDMHILLNTHSPYFLEAIEVYAEKHGISEKCRYYLAENTEDGAVIKDVTDNTEEIYKILAEPFQTLENARYGV
jgi:predicted ATPase